MMRARMAVACLCGFAAVSGCLLYFFVHDRRIQFPHSQFRRFALGAATPIGACKNNTALTQFAFTAFLSLATPAQNYIDGAVVLARSIRRVTNLDMVLLVLGDLSNETAVLAREGWTLCPIAPIDGPVGAVHNRFADAGIYSKLTAWNLTEYSAVLMLDLDMMVLSDPTDVFTDVLPRMIAENKDLGAAMDRPAADNYPHVITGAFTNWCHPMVDSYVFNAGSLLIVPSTRRFQALVRGISATRHDTNWAEQSYLNAFYGSAAFKLPFAYNGNAVSIVCEPGLWRSAKIVHFTIEKPWYGHRTVDVHGIRPYRMLWEELLARPPRAPRGAGRWDHPPSTTSTRSRPHRPSWRPRPAPPTQ